MNGYKAEPTEYVDVDRWRKAIRDSKLFYEAEANKLEERIDSLIAEQEHIKREQERIRVEEELMSQTIRAYEERMEQPSKRSVLQGNNLRETLIIHFASPNGKIVGKEATKSLVELGYFSNRNSADGAVYTALGKSPFHRLDKGIYSVSINSPEWKRLKTNGRILDARVLAQLGLKGKHRTGLVGKVTSMLVEYPNMNIKQVTKELQRQGWDFGGKNPISAVSAAFMRRRKDQKRADKQSSLILP